MHRLNSTGEYVGRNDYLRVDTSHVPPDEVGEHVIERFGLDRTDARPTGPGHQPGP